jgi:putative ABC transport system permease protein
MRWLGHDLRDAWRTLRAAPAFVATTLLVVGGGAGINTAVFAAVYGALVKPLPYAGSSRIVVASPLAPGVFLDWQRAAHSFSAMAAFRGASFNVLTGARAERVDGAVATAGLFDALGVRASLGRTFTDQEAATGARVAVISNDFWRRRFAVSAQAIGQRIVLDGEPFTVIGVLPTRVDFPVGVHVWVPPHHVVPAHPLRPDEDATEARSAIYLGVVARLKPGISLDAAEKERRAIAERIRAQYPREVLEEDLQTPLVSVRDWLVGDTASAIRVLMIAVSLVLLAACANVAGLLLARSASRRREFAIRAALGAARLRLARHLLVESGVLGLVSGIVGIAVARLALPALVAISPPDLLTVQPALEVPVILYAIGAALLASLVFGCAPVALLVWRPGSLVNAPRTDLTAIGRRTARAFIAIEFGVSFVLVVTAILLGTSLARLTAVNAGFDPRDVTAVELQLPATRYQAAPRQIHFFDDVLERLRVSPGVDDVAAAARLPFSGADTTRTVTIDGSPASGAWGGMRVISSGYFRVLGIPVQRGRGLDEIDRENSRRVAVVNTAMTRTYWPGQSPIGKRFRIGNDGAWFEIVGQVADTKYASVRDPAEPEFYVSYRQVPWSFMTIIVKSRLPETAISSLVIKASDSVDATLAVPDARPLATMIRGSLATDRFQALGMLAFAVTGLLIATVGLFGVTSYIVTRRTREIGVRLAVGATPRAVRWEVVGDALAPMGAGIAAGVLVAAGLTRVLEHRLFGVHATDVSPYVLAAVVLTATALAAAFFPARRASRVDPVVALRADP